MKFGEAKTRIKMKKKTINIVHALTYEYKKGFGTTIEGESMTVPGEAYTIHQLLERRRSGIPLDTMVEIREGHYASDADFDTIVLEPDHDMVDTEELARASEAVIAESRKKLDEEAKHANEAPPEGVNEDEGQVNSEGEASEPSRAQKSQNKAKKPAQPDE